LEQWPCHQAVLSGYGPVGASSASVPFFDGKREDFADFSYKLRAVLLEHNIDDIVFNPTAVVPLLAN
jgi:hypothetical protein